MEKSIQDWAKTGIDIQDACNLSGVVHSFSEFMTWLRKIYPNQGTHWYNNHPVCVLFADKIADLTGRPDTNGLFSASYEWCKRQSKGERFLYEPYSSE